MKDSESIFTSSLKDYCMILNEKTQVHIIEKKLKVKLALDKLIEYKNSLKDLFNLQSINLCIDNKLENYSENLKVCPGNEYDIESFLLESSIQLYKEIMQNTIK